MEERVGMEELVAAVGMEGVAINANVPEVAAEEEMAEVEMTGVPAVKEEQEVS